MCTSAFYGQRQSSSPKPATSSSGFRFDKAQRLASSTSGGGTPAKHETHLLGLQSMMPNASNATITGLHSILGGLGIDRQSSREG
tara:strand:- start:711 stop:965 length:255 start_codon:yes stop_codon:yes gene_type:complete